MHLASTASGLLACSPVILDSVALAGNVESLVRHTQGRRDYKGKHVIVFRMSGHIQLGRRKKTLGVDSSKHSAYWLLTLQRLSVPVAIR